MLVLEPSFHYSQWIEFTDAGGSGFACPDIFIVLENKILLFEVKLTQTPNAVAQMRQLYEPLLACIFNYPIIRCEIYRNAISSVETPYVKSLQDVVEFGTPDETLSWHLTLH